MSYDTFTATGCDYALLSLTNGLDSGHNGVHNDCGGGATNSFLVPPGSTFSSSVTHQSGGTSGFTITSWLEVQNPGSAGIGGVTIQTSGTNNTTQTNLNFVASSTDAAGFHVTPSNPTSGNEMFEVTAIPCPLSGGGTGLGCYGGQQASLPIGGTSGYDWFTASTTGWAQCVGTAACHNLLTDYPVDTTVAVPAATFNANTCTVGANSPLTMTGLTTTMTVTFTANSDTHATTGWGAPGAGVLYITNYPSAANTVTFYVCNNTSSNITTSASLTFNVSAR
jgi:hypothetical protein